MGYGATRDPPGIHRGATGQDAVLRLDPRSSRYRRASRGSHYLRVLLVLDPCRRGVAASLAHPTGRVNYQYGAPPGRGGWWHARGGYWTGVARGVPSFSW